MPNVLGLEIGRSTIKAVLMARKGLGGGRILDARILDVRDNEGIGPALQKLAEDKNFAGIPCFVSVPSQDVLFRHVRLPFRDDNRIRKTLLFELEPLIPLPIENVIADYIALPREGLLVGAMPKETIREIIEQVEKISATSRLLTPLLRRWPYRYRIIKKLPSASFSISDAMRPQPHFAKMNL